MKQLGMIFFIFMITLGCGKSPLSFEEEDSDSGENLKMSVSLIITETVRVGEEATIKWRSENAEWVEVTYVNNPTLNGEKRITFDSPGDKTITITGYNESESVTQRATIKVIENDAGDGTKDVEPIYITVDLIVTAIEGSQFINEAASVQIEKRGYYRIISTVEYSGNEEKNESYFLQAKDPNGNIRGPRNPNLVDLYKIIEDNGKDSRHQSKRYSGIFRMIPGKNWVELHHYAEISEHHQDFMNGDFIGRESVRILEFKLEYVGE